MLTNYVKHIDTNYKGCREDKPSQGYDSGEWVIHDVLRFLEDYSSGSFEGFHRVL
jgi:hypothetical protein